MTRRIAAAERLIMVSPVLRARIAGAFYLLDLVSSITADSVLRGTQLGVAADRFATACYVVVTVLLFGLLSAVSRTQAALTAALSLIALATWQFGHLLLDGAATDIGNVVFGAYCMSLGFLMYRSTFFPRVLGAAMALGGLGLLAYASPALVSHLYPYNAIPALVGETCLMLWLVVFGVDARRWEASARARGIPTRSRAG